MSGFPLACKFGSSEDDPIDSDDAINGRSRPCPAAIQRSRFTNYRRIIFPTGRMTRDLKRRHLPNGWLHKRVIFLCSATFYFQSDAKYAKFLREKRSPLLRID